MKVGLRLFLFLVRNNAVVGIGFHSAALSVLLTTEDIKTTSPTVQPTTSYIILFQKCKCILFV